MNMDSSIGNLKGIGDKTRALFEKLGIYSVRDMLLAFPRDYVKYPSPINILEVSNGTVCAIQARIKQTPIVKKTANMSVTIAKLWDQNGSMEAVWFRMPFLKNQLTPGSVHIFYGKVVWKKDHFVMEQPVIYDLVTYEQLQEGYQPVYPLVKGITNNLYRKVMRQCCDMLSGSIEMLPKELLLRNDLMDYASAIEQLHFPTNLEQLQAAHDRMAYQEFLFFILTMHHMQDNHKRLSNHCYISDTSILEDVISKLPYELTKGQKHALDEIVGDLKSEYAMQRLLQGDVGSGKTIVAFLAMCIMAANGFQSAIMAPTEVLANQHYESFTEWCKNFNLPFSVYLLTGSLSAKQKRETYERIAADPSAFVIGTHALIQEKVEYDRLGLVITDEQHRFGVRQRETFAAKGQYPHSLVMSATPIPRTLAMILYGNFDITVIKELPANRLPIKNCVVDDNYRMTAYHFMEKQIEEGHQIYIICPLVESSEQLEAENVIDYTGELREHFPTKVEIAYLHGKMKAVEKQEIMERFARNEIQILVSTTVIEVGVNVPNTTVMMIENADRFGLAQLHQLRGRVGRGSAQSYCIFMNSSKTEKAKKRLEILNKSNDGFEIASQDLKLRGPGDFFGIRQSGLMAFRVGDVYNDADILSKASEDSRDIIARQALEREDAYARLQTALIEYQKNQFSTLQL